MGAMLTLHDQSCVLHLMAWLYHCEGLVIWIPLSSAHMPVQGVRGKNFDIFSRAGNVKVLEPLSERKRTDMVGKVCER